MLSCRRSNAKHAELMQVDSSCYAIPSPRNVEKWVASVPSTFRFHFKVFGLFCAQSCPTNALPRGVREGLDGSLLAGANVRLSALPEDAVANVWSAFHGAIEPVRKVRALTQTPGGN